MQFQPSILSFFNFDFVETQRKSFFHFLEHGIIRELDKRSHIADSVQGLELVFYPREYKLTTPTLTPQQALLRSKTYESQLYVPAHCIDKTNKTIQIQWVLLGNVPLMTKRGHFIINGLPRVIVHQMTRSPGLYFSKKTIKKMVEKQPVLFDIFSAHILPLKGPPITLQMDPPFKMTDSSSDNTKNSRKCIQINKTGKLPLVVFLRGLGLASRKIIDALEYPERCKNEVYGWLENTESSQILDSIVYPEKKNEKKLMQEISRWFEDKGIPTTHRASEFLYAMLSTWPASKLGKNKITFADLAHFSRKGQEAQRLGQKLFITRFMHSRRYDLGKVGRTRLNTKLGLKVPVNQCTLTADDFLGATNALLRFSLGLLPQDDIDDLANKRVQTSGELIQNQFAVGISRLEKVIRERMKKSKSSFTVRGFITTKAVNGAFREFFGSNPLSQYMDQTNPLAEITHKRRVSSLGFGGISRETATMAIRGIHPTHYGRICPIETPEGQNAGLVNSMTTFSRINSLGFFETPFFAVFQGQIQKNQGLYFFSSEQENQVNVAPADLSFSHSNLFFQNSLPIRNNQKFQRVDVKKVEFMAINPIQMISIATALIPFLEHDDANRALMGSNMQRQSISFFKAERPIVRTGLEAKVVANSGQIIQASSSGFVSYSSGQTIQIESTLNFLKNEKTKNESIVSQADSRIRLPIDITSAKSNDSNIFSFLSAMSGIKNSLTSFMLQNKFYLYKTFSFRSLYSEWFFQTKPTKAQKLFLPFEQRAETEFINQLKADRNERLLENSYLREQELGTANNDLENLVYWQRKNWKTLFQSIEEKNFSIFFHIFLQRWQFFVLFESNQVNINVNPTRIETEFVNQSMLWQATLAGNIAADRSGSLLKKYQKTETFPCRQGFSSKQELAVNSVSTPFLNIFQKYNYLQNFLGVYSRQKKLDKSTPGSVKQNFLSLSNSVDKTMTLRTNWLVQGKNVNLQKTRVSKKIKGLFLETYKKKLTFLVSNGKNSNNSLFSQTRVCNSSSTNEPKTNTTVSFRANRKPIQRVETVFTGSGNLSLFSAENIKETGFIASSRLLENSSSKKQEMLQTLQYSLRGYERSNQKTYLKQRPCIAEGKWVQKGDIIADCASSVGGELALGKNLFIAYMPWEGYNFEDALLISEKLTEDDMFTSLHIERYEIEVRETKFGSEQITSKLPEIEPQQGNHLDGHGIAKVGSFVKHGDILVGKVTPIKKILFSPQQKLLHDVVEKPIPNMRDTSLRVPKGIKGRVVHTTIVSSEFVFPSSLSNTSKVHKKILSAPFITQQKTQKQNKQVTWGVAIKRKQNPRLENQNYTSLKQPIPASGSLQQTLFPKGWYHHDLQAIHKGNTNKKSYVPNQLSSVYKRSLQTKIEKPVGKTKKFGFQKLSVPTGKGTEKVYNFLQKPKKVYIFLAEKQILQRGDKLAGRHGNKGIVSQILPRQDMPYLPDGTCVDIVLNPLGVPSRMNVGQIFESLLGLAGHYLHEHYTIEPFDEAYGVEASRSLAYTKLYEARKKTNQSWLFNPEFPGKVKLFDGRTGSCFDQPVTVGKSYILKLVHLVDEKIHARSTGPYSLVTQQPLRGRSKQGGQRVGEMEVWAFEGFGAAYILQELLTIKSDDTQGRYQLMDAFLTKKSLLWNASESFKVLVRELQSICLDISLYPSGSHSIFSESLHLNLQRHSETKEKR